MGGLMQLFNQLSGLGFTAFGLQFVMDGESHLILLSV
jgi:hypothetical protein